MSMQHERFGMLGLVDDRDHWLCGYSRLETKAQTATHPGGIASGRCDPQDDFAPRRARAGAAGLEQQPNQGASKAHEAPYTATLFGGLETRLVG